MTVTNSTSLTRRDFLATGVAAGALSGGGLGAFYFGYESALAAPVRVGVIGTGDEGSVLIGALNPDFLQVRAIADIRPYNLFRAFHGEVDQPARPGLLSVYDWKTEEEARRHVKVYGAWQELIANAKDDGLEAVIIALPLFLHAPVAIAAMQSKASLHVLTEKLMGHTAHECKEMARVAHQTHRHLATGHQRHYNILYAQAAEQIRRGMLGELHYIRAQWHRSNLPGKDSWQQPLPPGVKTEKANALVAKLAELKEEAKKARGPDIEKTARQVRQLQAQIADQVLHSGKLSKEDRSRMEAIDGSAAVEMADRMAKLDPKKGRPAEKLGYEHMNITGAEGKVIYSRPAAEELIRWRLWDRTAAGLMAELGSHQLDAASIFIAAAHEGRKQHPLSVVAAANRPIFPRDRDCEDHVYCLLEFPAPGYDPKDPIAARKKIGVMYSSINGNGFGGYGETVCGTGGTLVLERELEPMLYKVAATTDKTKVAAKKTKDKSGAEHVTRSLEIDEQGDARALAVGQLAMFPAVRGYTEEIEHWAWCIRNADPENQPRCRPEVALGDAVIALVANMAAREGRRIDFQEAWFHAESPATPEGVPPDPARYGA